MELRSINDKPIEVNANVVCHDGTGVSIGYIKSFTPSSVIIAVEKPYEGRRQVRQEHVDTKIYIL